MSTKGRNHTVRITERQKPRMRYAEYLAGMICTYHSFVHRPHSLLVHQVLDHEEAQSPIFARYGLPIEVARVAFTAVGRRRML